ncbi:MAG: 30S ribosome-binding factor RbfA [Alphaproteobacteria bacterium]|nr:30S ribosome-binding factor RbfA [Alphaproteobacteria bacterium]
MSKSQHSGGPSLRLLRVGENVRHAISSILARGEVQDPDLAKASVTVSEVRISPDLRNATVFVMPLGGDPDLKVTKALNKNSAFLRGEMSKVVHMKYMPRLKFKLDESFDEASHIDTLLRDPRVTRDLSHEDEEE